MARHKSPLEASGHDSGLSRGRLAELEAPDAVAGIPGPGRWLIAEYEPTSLFSLKSSTATSSVGKTLIIPTPYAIKMALVDTAFRVGLPDDECAALVQTLAKTAVRIAPAEKCVVTHTFVKIRQEPHGGSRPEEPYISNIAYREVAHIAGRWRWAFDLAAGDDLLAEQLVRLAPHVNYIGKRGSFIQFLGLYRRPELDQGFTEIPDASAAWRLPNRSHVVVLDDFGPEATLSVLSSYTSARVVRNRHRRFTYTLVPMEVVNSGPGFTEYQRQQD